jgi:hypothetical protein
MIYHIHNTNLHFRVAKGKPNLNWTIGRDIWHKNFFFGTLVVKNVQTTNILLSMCKWTCRIACRLSVIPIHIYRIVFILPCLKTKTKAISHRTPSSYQSPCIINLTKVITSMLMTISRCKNRRFDLVKFKHVKHM